MIAKAGRTWAADGAALLGLLLVYYASPLLVAGLDYWGGDPTLLTYPNRHLLVSCLRQGILPLWNPWTGCGVPALAAYQGAFLYPLHLLVLPLFASFHYGTRVIAFFHCWLQAFGVYGLARHGMGTRRPAALFAGLAQGVCAFNAAHVEQFMIVAAASWVPLILWAWVRFLARPSAAAFAASAGAFAMAILAGHSQYWVYAINAMALLALLAPKGLEGRRDGQRGFKDWSRKAALGLAALGGVGAAAFLLASAQLLPTLELAGRSERAIDSEEYGAAWSFPPGEFLQYVAPERRIPPWELATEYNATEAVCFVGRITLPLALAGLALAWSSPAVRAFGALGLAAAVLALGANGPFGGGLFRIAEEFLPGWKGHRVPPRLLFFTGLALIALAGLGLDRLGGWAERRRSGAAARAAPWALAAACAAVVLFEQGRLSQRLLLRHSEPAAAVAPSAWLPGFFRSIPGEYRVFQLIDSIAINRFDARAGAGREAILEPNNGTMHGVATVRAAYEGLLPLLRVEDFLREYWRDFYAARPDAELLGLMNIRFLASDKPIEGAHWRSIAWVAPCEEGRRPIAVFQNDLALERVVWAEALESRYDLRALDGRFVWAGEPSEKREAPAGAPRRIGAPPPRADLPPIAIRRISPNALEIAKPPAAGGGVALIESAYPGWRARWAGGSADLAPLNAIHMRFDAPPGIETIRLVFEPFSFRLGLFLSLAALAGLALARAAGWMPLRAKRR